MTPDIIIKTITTLMAVLGTYIISRLVAKKAEKRTKALWKKRFGKLEQDE